MLTTSIASVSAWSRTSVWADDSGLNQLYVGSGGFHLAALFLFYFGLAV